MNPYKYSSNYDDPLLAELYDQSETYTDDVDLIRRLIGNRGPFNILECFSGTGRLLVPLAYDGHKMTGIDIAASMSKRAFEKIARMGKTYKIELTSKYKMSLSVSGGQDMISYLWGVVPFMNYLLLRCRSNVLNLHEMP